MRSDAMKRAFVLGAVVMVVAVGGFGAMGQEAEAAGPLDLRAIWRVDQLSKYRITQSETTTTTASMLAEPRVVTMNYIVDVAWRVLEAAEGGGGKAEMRTEDVRVEVISPDGETLTATASGADEGLDAYRLWAEAMTSAGVELTVSADGVIESVSGVDAVKAAADPNVAEGLDEEYFKNIALELATLTGGSESVSIGDTWEGSHETDHQFGRLTIDTTYRLDGFEEISGIGVAYVSTESQITLDPEAPAVPPGVPAPEVELTDSSASGTLVFDMTRHELVGGNSNQTIEVTVTITPPDGPGIDVVTREVTSVKLLRTAEE